MDSRSTLERVRVSASADGEITVEDDGPGIEEALRETVLERGKRLDEKSGGAGLGLAIAKEYVLAHRGKIEVVEEGSGGHFRVKLPLNWEKKD